ncbi:hypothetical protein F52700_9566 [Fusarium sp. NRRL 52700]|nr:hypothetical protein F52700_9566 [Fusarium sp. NRRL 52700]
MSSSIQTLSRGVRTAPRALRGLSQVRRLSTTEPSRNLSNTRDSAVHDPIMDKFWGNSVNISETSSIVTETPSISATTTSRDPPLGTNVFEPSSAPRWSGISIPTGRQ